MHFYGVKIADDHLAFLFDAARFVVQPDALRKTHITVRGPYNNRINLSKLNKKPLGDLGILQPANFLLINQNTVFLKCEVVGIRDVWHKPDFQDGVVHLTIYDGKNHEHAKEIYDCLNSYKWNIWTKPTNLHLLEKKIINSTTLLFKAPRFVYEFNNLINPDFDIEHIQHMDFKTRKKIFNTILNLIIQRYST